MKTPTIYEIRYNTIDKHPHFFDRKTLKFFGQSMKTFKVEKTDVPHKFKISSPRYFDGVQKGETVRIYNAKTEELECLT